MTRKSAKNTGNFTFLEHFAAFPPHFAILNREKSVLEGRSVAASLPGFAKSQTAVLLQAK
jgi:hypothetical protein